MTRRLFLGAVSALGAQAQTQTTPTPAPVKLGIDLFSIRSQNWTPFQYLDYCAAQKVHVVHFSEVRFIGGLDPANLKKVRDYAKPLGIEIEIGMKSVCPTSKMFDAKDGTAEQQLAHMIESAQIVGSKIVRCVLGSSDDRKDGAIQRNIDSMVTVLRNTRSRALDANIKIAIENHAGDMQGRELKSLVEAAGADFVGVCLDSGNPLWTLEDPHLTLETLHPYVLTSHVRDSAVWNVPEGIAVAWTRMGEGNVNIDEYVKKYAQLCPGRALSMETIVTGPRIFPYHDPKFWDAYRNDPAWEFARFLKIAERGKPYQKLAGQHEREDLEASLAYTRKVLGLPGV
jgi:sugar phosphate isomerase/epimerase